REIAVFAVLSAAHALGTLGGELAFTTLLSPTATRATTLLLRRRLRFDLERRVRLGFLEAHLGIAEERLGERVVIVLRLRALPTLGGRAWGGHEAHLLLVGGEDLLVVTALVEVREDRLVREEGGH